ncbi:hypothetical protein HanXRQr2_Chr03g0133641 [Helianthus annuus]|uniref:Uncharacterized protein n=1 Tax=Helianthus annuus TaxID=4232 RepID=A0A251VAL4_HELAN|nr:hypothetical protein HanXRQr2_Chr03g0133641 [Helianthus annuus]KAJ0945639.1 hypothetical protein HanPSC8_Chr03g0130391 [Helianthus annuus]
MEIISNLLPLISPPIDIHVNCSCEVVRNTWSLHWEARSLWTRIMNALIKHYDIIFILMLGYFYASAKH